MPDLETLASLRLGQESNGKPATGVCVGPGVVLAMGVFVIAGVDVGSRVCVGLGVAVVREVFVATGIGSGVATLCAVQAVSNIMKINREQLWFFI